MRPPKRWRHCIGMEVECWVDAQPTIGYLRHLLSCSTLRYAYHFTGKVQSVKSLMLSGRCTYEGVIVKVSYFPYI